MKKRSSLAIILSELERLFKHAGLKWCWMKHGPVPLLDSQVKLSDNNIYDIEILAQNLPFYELQTNELPLPAIYKEYQSWKKL